MIIKKLVLNNYKTFYGHQELDLDIPDNSRQDNKNIILIGGLNGSGKTSILKAIHYSLFGKRGMSPEEYKRIFSNVINNTFFNEGGRECYIVLTVEVNNKEEWELKTKWIFDHSKIQVHETREITIRKPGARIGRTQIINNMETYNRFIDRTIPYHVAPFFIFDGEEIKDIILRQNSYEMKEAIQKLSGLEAYKALKTDLTDALSFLSTKIFKANASKSPETNQDKVKYELAETNKSLDEFKARKDKEENRKTKLLDQIQALKKERENKIKLNASSREVYVKKLTASETKLQSFETNFTKEFMDSAFDILLRDQYLLLQKELKKEESYMQQKLVKEASLVPYQNFISNLFEVELDPPLTSTQKENLMLSGEKIWSKLNKINSELEEIELLHDLNKEQHRKLMNLPIKTSQHLTNIYNQMEKERTLIQQYESEIRKAPESVDIEEENEKIDNLTKMLGEVELRLKSATRKINTLSEERARLSKKLTQTEKKEDNNNQYQEQFEAIALIIQFLDDYIEKLTKLKANFIHEQFKLMLNQLFRKQDEFGKIEFDMSSFTIRLYNDRNQEISVHDRSAGEMQIISSALIWALTKSSRYALPMIIDTPLGRLDSYHRSYLIDHYYKELSEQVIILSTDTEITEDYIKQIKDSTYNQFTLDYDQNRKYTLIIPGYFQAKGVV
ncbi:DNA sulfur modification protein DndD [Paenibacillus sp. FSL M8-0228]|jgi:DNA sulfur modification protein DndD|uniref:DNA sulfur modification protein DndD n=1 Tax=Paenibacillus TaxID=44249 RepID=UPI00083D82FC|nr:DNA sulfur modification protein DndD [Paenibacillus polymyxa]MBO3284814.1 DNA sulfur modification protein DndD [Paenibacillus polymyxa]ODB53766.1 DNA sulfur modification protein DndD [Paenibacillus polymyxa]